MTKLRLSVEPRAGGTVQTFVHSGFHRRGKWADLYEGAIHGWSYLMMSLKSALDHGHDLCSPLDR